MPAAAVKMPQKRASSQNNNANVQQREKTISHATNLRYA